MALGVPRPLSPPLAVLWQREGESDRGPGVGGVGNVVEKTDGEDRR
jgi:hypothetical protein